MWKSPNGNIINNFKDKIIEMIQSAKNPKIIVGTDSQITDNKISYVTTIVVLNVGFGGQFIYNKQFENLTKNLLIMQNRLYYQVVKSVDIAKMIDKIIKPLNLKVQQIHADVNSNKKFKSNKIISACISFIDSNGYIPIVKPNAYVSSKIADHFTR